ncbi:MAG: gamma-glutamyltransferase [Bdellovibrionales bacterium]|nr:gamma-glutamyltransferase [Bdellovibrionales bacterium]
MAFLWIAVAWGTLAIAGTLPKAPRGGFDDQAQSKFRATVGMAGMVAADDQQSAEFGAKILRSGGNAVDAAVATAFAMSVSRPHYASLGGGGFFLICLAASKECHVLDFRERAPQAATRDMYSKIAKTNPHASVDGALAIGVPGNVAGLLEAQAKWGKKKRQDVLSVPIRWAREGVLNSAMTENCAWDRWEAFNDESRKIWGCGDKPCPVGHKIVQKDLAKVLQAISDQGRKGFYEGWVAQAISDSVKKAGGILSVEDLKKYQPTLRKPLSVMVESPVEGKVEVLSVPPPSAGGTGVLQMISWMDLAWKQGVISKAQDLEAQLFHALAHALKLAFSDRAALFGDPDYTPDPSAKLLNPDFLKERWKTFDPTKAVGVNPSQAVSGLTTASISGRGLLGDISGDYLDADVTGETTHMSVIDGEGNAVAFTFTVNDFFGSGFTAKGTGVVLNNEMDDFASEPGKPNLFGLIGSEANSIAPGKRPLSSMSPTLVRKNGEVILSLGAQGGPRITSSVFQTLFHRLYLGRSLPDSVHAARVHHQWKPDQLMFEARGFPASIQEKWKTMGYTLKEIANAGKQHAIERFPESGRVWGVSDLRTEGAAVAQ